MITQLQWQCPPGLIEQALEECPVTGEGTVLNESTGNFFYDNWEIKDLYKNTAWEKVLDTLPHAIGQARIIKLEPGESYMGHADIDNRWHLNLTGEQAYLIDLANQVMHKCKKDNRWCYMDAGRIHAATNYGSIPRLQLVVRELLFKSSEPKDLIDVIMEPAYDQYDFRYKFDNIISPWLNKANQDCKLADFAHDFSRVSFKMERELKQELDSLSKLYFKIIY